MKRKLRVLIVSPEVAPYAAAGPLAEAARAAMAEAAAGGACVSLVMPRYRRPEIDALPLEIFIPELWVPLGSERIKAAVLRAPLAEGEVFFIDNAKYFLRDGIYGTENNSYLDNDERFVFFSRAVVELVLKAKLAVDVIHCLDWTTALVPLFLRTHYAQKPHFKDTAVVLTLRDASAQGQFPAESMALTGLNWDYFTPAGLEQNGKFSFLKAGMIFADALTGLSPEGTEDAALGEILKRRRDVILSTPAAGTGRIPAPGDKEALLLYEHALLLKKGGPVGR